MWVYNLKDSPDSKFHSCLWWYGPNENSASKGNCNWEFGTGAESCYLWLCFLDLNAASGSWINQSFGKFEMKIALRSTHLVQRAGLARKCACLKICRYGHPLRLVPPMLKYDKSKDVWICVCMSVYLYTHINSSGAMQLFKVVDKFKIFHIWTVAWCSGSTSIPVTPSHT